MFLKPKESLETQGFKACPEYIKAKGRGETGGRTYLESSVSEALILGDLLEFFACARVICAQFVRGFYFVRASARSNSSMLSSSIVCVL